MCVKLVLVLMSGTTKKSEHFYSTGTLPKMTEQEHL